ncbi:MAG: peptide chain release factor N(5)-glutamine methyltransferase [Litoricolaceae bacterium]|nr:peptide chain release factor N(5)-glutamine methyltransferase [Litorivicinaceae bacterium]
MNLSEVLRSDPIRAAAWSTSEQQLVISEILGLSLTEQVLQSDQTLSEAVIERLHQVAKRTQAGEPVAYILGVVDFDGLRLSVSPHVLIPRPDTEILVETASQLIEYNDLATIHDLCTGSGAVGIALKTRHPNCHVTLSDLSTDAVQCAKANAQALGLSVNCLTGDLFDGLGCYDLVTANPPYIAWDDPEIDSSVQLYEPAIALFSNAQGLELIRWIVSDGMNHLTPNGYLCLEHGHRQAHYVRAMAEESGWRSIQTHQDLAGRDRVTRMQKR